MMPETTTRIMQSLRMLQCEAVLETLQSPHAICLSRCHGHEHSLP